MSQTFSVKQAEKQKMESPTYTSEITFRQVIHPSRCFYTKVDLPTAYKASTESHSFLESNSSLYNQDRQPTSSDQEIGKLGCKEDCSETEISRRVETWKEVISRRNGRNSNSSQAGLTS